MTPEERAAARARCEAAAEGPWEIDDNQRIVWSKDGLIMHDRSDMSSDDWADGYRDDAAFIAASRTDLPAALDELDAKDAEIERLEKWAQAIGYDLSAVEECQRTHVQNCTACPRLECCDNLSPIHEYGVKLNRLERERERMREYADKLVDAMPGLPKDLEVLRIGNINLANENAALRARNAKLERVAKAAKDAVELLGDALVALDAKEEE